MTKLREYYVDKQYSIAMIQYIMDQSDYQFPFIQFRLDENINDNIIIKYEKFTTGQIDNQHYLCHHMAFQSQSQLDISKNTSKHIQKQTYLIQQFLPMAEEYLSEDHLTYLNNEANRRTDTNANQNLYVVTVKNNIINMDSAYCINKYRDEKYTDIAIIKMDSISNYEEEFRLMNDYIKINNNDNSRLQEYIMNMNNKYIRLADSHKSSSYLDNNNNNNHYTLTHPFSLAILNNISWIPYDINDDKNGSQNIKYQMTMKYPMNQLQLRLMN